MSKGTMAIASLLLSAWVALADPGPQTAAPSPPAGIAGHLVNVESHQPVRRAAVKIYNRQQQWNAISDGDGQFRFDAVTPGEYTLVVHRVGYTDRAIKVTTADFEKPTGLSIDLRPQGVISGKVVDQFGQPLAGVKVDALRNMSRNSGEVKLEVISSAESDDLGEYRVSGLNAGSAYQVRATFRDGRRSEFDMTPQTVASAWFGAQGKPADLTVKSGAVTPEINCTLVPGLPLNIRGTLRTEQGPLTGHAKVWMTGQMGEAGSSADSLDGQFAVREMPPGVYTVSAITSNEAAPLFGQMSLSVRDADVDNVNLLLLPVPKLQVTLQFASGSSTPPLNGLSVMFFRVNPLGNPAVDMRIARSGRESGFTVALIPGEYLVNQNGPPANFEFEQLILNGIPVKTSRVTINDSRDPNKLVIVVKEKDKP